MLNLNTEHTKIEADILTEPSTKKLYIRDYSGTGQ